MKTAEEEVTDEILCNMCGESMRDSQNINYEGLVEAEIRGGYASALGDQVVHQFSLCEKCLANLFQCFAIPPTRWDNMAPYEVNVAEHEAMLEKVKELLEKRRGSG